ncbi:MAG: nucleotidyltransferase family protein [Acidobacteriia bacterium]|nr:nucleotidyltransferase family protein [Terriglobia bacterium]
MPDERENSLPVSSSKPPAFCKQQESLFREVINLLEQNRVPFVISGAFALHEHTGIWRDTKDLDLFLPAQEVGHALRILEKDGFKTEILDSVWLAKAKRDGFFVDLITGMSNAVLRVDYSWIRHASRAEVFGMSMRVLAPEELIASKIFVTRRERFDGADICHVIYGTRGKFDWQRLMSLIGDHWQMLFWSLVLYHYVYPANSDYVPKEIWTELVQRFTIELAHPNMGAEFRGSLIDEKMFAIDVAEWGKRNILEECRAKAEMIREENEEAA